MKSNAVFLVILFCLAAILGPILRPEIWTPAWQQTFTLGGMLFYATYLIIGAIEKQR